MTNRAIARTFLLILCCLWAAVGVVSMVGCPTQQEQEAPPPVTASDGVLIPESLFEDTDKVVTLACSQGVICGPILCGYECNHQIKKCVGGSDPSIGCMNCQCIGSGIKFCAQTAC